MALSSCSLDVANLSFFLSILHIIYDTIFRKEHNISNQCYIYYLTNIVLIYLIYQKFTNYTASEIISQKNAIYVWLYQYMIVNVSLAHPEIKSLHILCIRISLQHIICTKIEI